MKTKQIRKFRIIDKEYLPENVVAIDVEDTDYHVEITYIYDRDGQTKIARFSMEQLKLLHSIYTEIKYGE